MNVVLQTSTKKTSPRTCAVKYIAVHYTAGTTSKKGSARNVARYFANSTVNASADFVVDDYEAVQYNPNPRTRYCWAVGATKKANNKGGKLWGKANNRNTISVEICSSLKSGYVYATTKPNSDGWYFTPQVLAMAVELVKELMKEYKIDADHVIRHYDVTGKLCPAVIGWNEDSGSTWSWRQFKKAIADEV